MTDPRPDADSELAGESEYGNDTGFAADATSWSAGSDWAGPTGDPTGEPAGESAAGPAGGTGDTGPADEPAAGETAAEDPDDDPGPGAD